MPNKMTDNDIIKAWDILEKLDFFGGQRAGRELWNEKPVDVQDKDIKRFSEDVAFLKDFINRQQAEIERLKDVLIKLRELHDRAKGIIATQNGEIECLKDELLESNIEIAELYKCKFSAEDVAQNIIRAKAEAVKEFTERLKEHYPHSPTVCNTIDRVAEEMKGRLEDDRPED